MTRLLAAALLCAATSTAAAARQTDDWAPLVARAREFVDRLASGQVDPLFENFTDKMKAAVDAARLRAVLPNVALSAGAFKSCESHRTERASDAIRRVVLECTFERGRVDVSVSFEPAGRFAGFGIRPATTPTYTPPAYVTPAAFRDEQVTVDADGWPLPGTLSLPVGAGPFPGIVLVHGSGPVDRDATVGPNKVFRDLAEGLASRGIAVLRYEKRTRIHAARIAGRQDFTVTSEVVEDAAAAVRLLQRTKGVKADRVFVAGHSLGGMLAPRVAVAEPSVAGLIVLAGAVRSLEEAIVEQTRYLAMADGSISPEEQKELDRFARFAADVKALKPGDPAPSAMPFSAPTSYFLDLRGYDPPAAAARLGLPMLILQGERDYQVTMVDLEAWRRAVGARANVRIVTYPALNHLFIAGTGPSLPAEYMTPAHVDEAVVRDIAAWTAKQ